VQIGGPTGAFIVVVYGVIARHGFDGLLLATLMAGAILLVAGLLRAGRLIALIPEAVIEGFHARHRDRHRDQPDQGPARPGRRRAARRLPRQARRLMGRAGDVQSGRAGDRHGDDRRDLRVAPLGTAHPRPGHRGRADQRGGRAVRAARR